MRTHSWDPEGHNAEVCRIYHEQSEQGLRAYVCLGAASQLFSQIHSERGICATQRRHTRARYTNKRTRKQATVAITDGLNPKLV